jgi:large subunit ribosomal protein L28
VSRRCAICGREPGHSNRKTNRRWLPNLQRMRVLVDGAPRRVPVCTRCLRSGKVARPV